MVSFPGPYGTTTAPAQTHIRYNNQGLKCSDTLLKHVTVLHSGGGGWGEVTALGAWKKSEAPQGCLQPYLEPGMGIELIQEIHEEVNLEGANT